MKKLMSLMVAFALLVAILPIQANAAEITASGTCGDNLTWELTNDGTLTISGTGAMAKYNTYSTYAPWYDYRGMVKSIIIAEGVTTIGYAAFYNLSNLTSIDIPASLVRIESFAFSLCDSLLEIFIPENVQAVDRCAFGFCENLEHIEVSPNNTKYSSYNGILCDKAGINLVVYPAGKTEVSFPESVQSISEYAFYTCEKISDVIIPEKITNIGQYAFYESSLKTIVLHNNVTFIGEHAFSATPLREIVLPEGINQIGGFTFSNCQRLNNITIPTSVQSIGLWAFFGCSDLRYVYYAGSQAQWEAIAKDDIQLDENAKVIYNHPEHNIVTDSGSDATCTKDGLTEGTHCSICNMVFSDQKTIPSPGHSWSGAPCTETQTCTVCGETTPPVGHQWFAGGTCLEPEKCTVCGVFRVEPGHTFTDASDDTCDVCGLFVLRGCVGETYDISITTPYDYNHYVEGSGWEKVTMIYTGQSGVSIPGYTRYSKNYRLTFSEPGIYDLTAVQYSTGSRLKFGAEISDHDWKLTNTIQATCTQVGHDVYSCTNCGINEHRNITDFASHNWSDATCTTPKTCKVCGATEGSTLPHTEVTDAAVAATCTATGKTEGKHCSVCNTVIVAQQEVPKKAHTEVVDAGVAATCTAAGKTEGKHCSVCGTVTVAQQTISAKGHTEVVDKSVAATCTADGKTEGKHCDLCNTVIVAQQNVPATGHTYDNGVDGTCNGCGIHREETEDRTVMHMFRMYDPNSGEHFYTGSVEERENLVAAGWNYEGVGFTFSRTTGLPVYRLYDPATGEHLYTMSEEEKAMLEAQGWNFEGIAFNSAYDTEVPQYRLHNPNATRGAYHFTASLEERDYLISIGWEDQGIGFYSSWK